MDRCPTLDAKLDDDAFLEDDALAEIACDAGEESIEDEELPRVHLSWQVVRELVEHERGLVRKDAGLLRPEPDRREILVLARGEVDDSIDHAAHADDATILEVLCEELGRVAGLRCLLRREVPFLADRSSRPEKS